MIGLARRRKVKCGDGSVRFVHRSVEKAFPFHFSEYSTKVAAALKVLNELEASASAEIKSRLAALTYEIDDINRSLIANFRMSYEGYAADPCGRSDWLAGKIDQLIEGEQRARHLYAALDRLLTSVAGGLRQEELVGMLDRLVEALRMGAPITDSMMGQASQMIDRWAGEPKNENPASPPGPDGTTDEPDEPEEGDAP